MRCLWIIPLLVFLLPTADSQQRYREKIWKYNGNAWYMGKRVLLLMKTIHRDGQWRHKKLNKIRFMYEETPMYEMGYILGEIIERYKKMLPQVRRQREWANIFIHDMIRRVQVTQHLYLQVYNLVRMMHEIEIKYKDTDEYSDMRVTIDMDQIMDYEHEKQVRMEHMAYKKNIQLEKLRKMKKKKAKREKKWNKYKVPGKRMEMWPLDYGWDIGTDWVTYSNPYGL